MRPNLFESRPLVCTVGCRKVLQDAGQHFLGFNLVLNILYFAFALLVYSSAFGFAQALRHLSPPEYQLLNNGKLFTTSLIYRVVRKKAME